MTAKPSSFFLYDYLPVGVFVIDRQFDIKFWNKTLIRYSGINANEIVGKSIFDIFPHLKSNKYKNRIEDVFESGGPVIFSALLHGHFIPCMTKTGDLMVQETLVYPMKTSDEMGGKVEMAVFSIMDLSQLAKISAYYKNEKRKARAEVEERKKSEEHILALLKKLEQKNRELDQFNHIVSHDLRAPLQGINMVINYIREDINEGIDVSEKLNLVETRIVRLVNMINSLLEYAKMGKSEISACEIDMNNLINEVICDLNIPKNVEVSLKAMPVIYNYRVLVSQVFANVIGNAVKYGDKSTIVIHVDYCEDENMHVFTVSDNGPGIPERHREKIFDIFFSLNTKKEVESSGIGLSTVKKIIVEMGGDVSVDTAELGGAKFIIKWPKVVQH